MYNMYSYGYIHIFMIMVFYIKGTVQFRNQRNKKNNYTLLFNFINLLYVI